jgi:hypothetical protein
MKKVLIVLVSLFIIATSCDMAEYTLYSDKCEVIKVKKPRKGQIIYTLKFGKGNVLNMYSDSIYHVGDSLVLTPLRRHRN